FQAIGSDVPVEEGVAVPLRDVVPGKLGFGVVVIKVGKFIDHACGQVSQVACRHQMTFCWPPGRVPELTIPEPDLLCETIQLSRESLLASGQPFRQNDAGIIAGLDDDAAQKVLDPDLASQL